MPKNRKKGTQKLGRRLHIFCEGEKTEPIYLSGYARSIPRVGKKLRIIDIEKTKKNTPKQLVNEAIKLKRDRNTPKGDVFWVVYDRENIAKYPDQLHADAFTKAADHEIHLAISNVCFEIWILLHFQNSSKPYSNFDELAADPVFKRHLASIGINNYDKADAQLFELLEDKVNLARAHATAINRNSAAAARAGADKAFQLNPYTGVVDLLQAIDNFLGK